MQEGFLHSSVSVKSSNVITNVAVSQSLRQIPYSTYYYYMCDTVTSNSVKYEHIRTDGLSILAQFIGNGLFWQPSVIFLKIKPEI